MTKEEQAQGNLNHPSITFSRSMPLKGDYRSAEYSYVAEFGRMLKIIYCMTETVSVNSRQLIRGRA